MIFFITVLKALAAILITNAHYTGVYPSDLISNGGLLGDVLFFAVSGFLLVNIRMNFFPWYWKRIIRVYPSIWIITGIYLFLGLYTFTDWTLTEYFLFPTYYHFIASIIILYIPYYFVMKIDVLTKNIPLIMLMLFLMQIIIYLLFYEKSYYHIDTVREPMIRFLFFQSMILGAYFRIHKIKYIDKNLIRNWLLLILFVGVYFSTKLAFLKFEAISSYQIVNQVFLYILLYFVFKCFASIDSYLEQLPEKIKKIINFIANITLEIYLVQYVIIPKFAPIIFPLNWLLISTLIIISAYLLKIIGTKVSDNLDFTSSNKFSMRTSRGVR